MRSGFLMLAPRRRSVSVVAASFALFTSLAGLPAARSEPDALTPYERARVREAVAKLGLPSTPEPQPDGKIVEAIDVEVLEVFDHTDPVPKFVNVFHATTRERVVRRELLFDVGKPFATDAANESARNLRKLRQHSLVVIVALPGSAPERVRVLVLVKDVWSLRLNYDIEVSDRSLNYLVLNLAEENLLGTHATLGGTFSLDPGSYSFGLNGHKRSMFGSDVDLTISGSIIYGRATGRPEGATGGLVYGAPFASVDSKWAWGTGVSFRSEMLRYYDRGRVARYDAPATAVEEALPLSYRAERIVGGYELTRSFGRVHKVDLTLGVDADRRYYRWEPPTGTSRAAAAEFREVWLPVTDTRVGPFVQLFQHDERYLRTSELETLGLEENYRLGFGAMLRLYPASRSVGSSRSLLGVLAGASHTLALGDGLLRVIGVNRTEYERSGRHDADALGRVSIASPRVGFVRLLLDGLVRSRYQNYLNRRFELGGDTRLRGYPPGGFQGALVGPSAAVVNAEIRSRSIDIFGTAAGLAAFYDAGDVKPRVADLRFKQSAGFGARVAFPQFSRMVMRADWAFPFTPAAGYATFPGAFFITFDQAFPLSDLRPPTVMDPSSL
jgi:hypothetical protein